MFLPWLVQLPTNLIQTSQFHCKLPYKIEDQYYLNRRKSFPTITVGRSNPTELNEKIPCQKFDLQLIIITGVMISTSAIWGDCILYNLSGDRIIPVETIVCRQWIYYFQPHRVWVFESPKWKSEVYITTVNSGRWILFWLLAFVRWETVRDFNGRREIMNSCNWH